jgi:hypothetical protein
MIESIEAKYEHGTWFRKARVRYFITIMGIEFELKPRKS